MALLHSQMRRHMIIYIYVCVCVCVCVCVVVVVVSVLVEALVSSFTVNQTYDSYTCTCNYDS